MGLLAVHGSKKKKADDIPMAAMPDIAFLLLMFFMVSTTFLVTRTLDVELPAYTKEQPKEKKDRLTVFLAQDSLRLELRGEGEKIELWELEDRVFDAIDGAQTPEERIVMLDINKEKTRKPSSSGPTPRARSS